MAEAVRVSPVGVSLDKRADDENVHVGPGTWLRVAVKQPEAVHEIRFGKLQEWLDGGARVQSSR